MPFRNLLDCRGAQKEEVPSFVWGNQGRLHSQAMLGLSLKRIVGSEEERQQHNVFAVQVFQCSCRKEFKPRKLRLRLWETREVEASFNDSCVK